ncbi:MAG: hypothetical protein ACLQJR_00915 [Stellaceae bacterium]
MKRKTKTLYLNDAPISSAPISSASTWHEVAAVLTKLLRRGVSAREAQDSGSEGPDGFYVRMER